jgi:hypothetical protein
MRYAPVCLRLAPFPPISRGLCLDPFAAPFRNARSLDLRAFSARMLLPLTLTPCSALIAPIGLASCDLSELHGAWPCACPHMCARGTGLGLSQELQDGWPRPCSCWLNRNGALLGSRPPPSSQLMRRTGRSGCKSCSMADSPTRPSPLSGSLSDPAPSYRRPPSSALLAQQLWTSTR